MNAPERDVFQKMRDALILCILWESDYRTLNNLGKRIPDPFRLAKEALACYEPIPEVKK